MSKLTDNTVRYSKTPASGLALLSTIGQPSLLSDAETREAMRIVAEAASINKVLIAGVARRSVTCTLELIEFAAQLGYDCVLVEAPQTSGEEWNGQHDRKRKELLTFYKAVADRSALAMLLQSRGVLDLDLNSVVELARHPNIIGIVEGSRDAVRVIAIVERTAETKREVLVTPVFSAVTRRMLLENERAKPAYLSAEALADSATVSTVAVAVKPAQRTRTKQVGFQILCGRTSAVLESLAAGATGAMPSLAACAPQACYEVLAALKDGDPALAAEKQERVRPAAAMIEGIGVSGIKFGCDLNGYFGGRPRLPTLPLTGRERDEIKALMQGIRN